MKNYNDIELEIGINVGEPDTDSSSWVSYTQDMRRNAIKDTEIDMLRKSIPAKIPKLHSLPTVPTISSNVLTLSPVYHELLELYYINSDSSEKYFIERNREWDKLQDTFNFSTINDPYWYLLGERKYQLRHSITSASDTNFRMICLKMPHSYDASFSWGTAYTEFDGYEETIINGASGRLLIKARQPELGGIFMGLYNEGIKSLQ